MKSKVIHLPPADLKAQDAAWRQFLRDRIGKDKRHKKARI